SRPAAAAAWFCRSQKAPEWRRTCPPARPERCGPPRRYGQNDEPARYRKGQTLSPCRSVRGLNAVQHLPFHGFQTRRDGRVPFDVVDGLLVKTGPVGVPQVGLDEFIRRFRGSKVAGGIGNPGGNLWLHHKIDPFVGGLFVLAAAGNGEGINPAQSTGF